MTRQDYFCLYDAIHTLVRQDEISKEQVPLLIVFCVACCRFRMLSPASLQKKVSRLFQQLHASDLLPARPHAGRPRAARNVLSLGNMHG